VKKWLFKKGIQGADSSMSEDESAQKIKIKK